MMTSMLRSLILVWPNDLVLVKVISQLDSTFGYVAPEYENTRLLNEKSDISSFGGRVIRIDHRKRSCGLWSSCPRFFSSSYIQLVIIVLECAQLLDFFFPGIFEAK
ncbi:hypothetical protein RDI58_018181 [Solanum bulbocastanum]|uniref:Uncharacterized protein n=1 Tax=Solanum bulbocastanum TaxID=147425 RepID=A0AAN8TG19_SOLBU